MNKCRREKFTFRLRSRLGWVPIGQIVASMGNEGKRPSRPRDAAAHERAEPRDRLAEGSVLERPEFSRDFLDRGGLRLDHAWRDGARRDRALADRDAADAAPAEIAVDPLHDDRRQML